MNTIKRCTLGGLLTACLFSLDVHAQWTYPPVADKWDGDQLGNHRAVVKVDNTDQNDAQVVIPWRNRWMKSDQQILIIDSASNKKVAIDAYEWINIESGAFRFKPLSAQGTYYIYYLPYQMGGRSRNYPDAIYLKNATNAPSLVKEGFKNSKGVSLIRFESIDSFNSNDPMEVIATQQEVSDFIARRPQADYYIFPEPREFQVKMEHHLPQRWMDRQFNFTNLAGKAKRGEYYAFQVALWSPKQELKDVQISFSDFKSKDGKLISAGQLNCLNTEGVDYTGQPMRLKVEVPSHKVQPLWCGVQIPEGASPGIYEGTVRVKPVNAKEQYVSVMFEISNEVVKDHGADQPWNMTRLPWLNSVLAQKNTVIAPYTALKMAPDSSIQILGRSVKLDASGLPAQINTFFTPELTEISDKPNHLLAAPVRFSIYTADGQDIKLKSKGIQFTDKAAGEYSWQASSSASQLDMFVSGRLEFDGYLHYEIKLTAQQDIALKDIRMDIPVRSAYATYFMGLGEKGGTRRERIQWKWDVAHKNQDGGWIGAVQGGLQFSLRDENYSRPLNTNFYLQKPLVLPTSWGNSNKGGIDIIDSDGAVIIQNYSGDRVLKKGEVLHFNFNFLITPFHTLDTDSQWGQRYYHAYKPVDSVVQSGSNVINIHHANIINPYINYPFVATKEMKQYIDNAHQAGLKVKIYNTVREVSNRVYELYPLRSLGHEVFSPGKGQGYSWLQEHLDQDYIAAWYVPEFKDAAIINSGMNRWHNYYVEGMNWLVDRIGIDGIYLDDVAFDRITMKRIKRVLTQQGKSGLIDLHSANQYNKNDGFNNSANLYLEHFPYLNRLWFGEYFDYENSSPDFFLTEVSGIPFGLMGEMLQDGGNPWRGMIYGMTNRMPYQKLTPEALWRAWDDFGIKGSKMIGYWSPNIPVKTNNEKVLTTVYQKEGKVMIAIASWAADDTTIQLDIDWQKLGLDPKRVRLYAPSIDKFQSEGSYNWHDQIPVEKNKGRILIIE